MPGLRRPWDVADRLDEMLTEMLAGDFEVAMRVVAQIVNQLRHTFTAPGIVAWFQREHPRLGERPIEVLDDPLRHPELVDLARAARTTTA